MSQNHSSEHINLGKQPKIRNQRALNLKYSTNYIKLPTNPLSHKPHTMSQNYSTKHNKVI